MFTDAKIVCDKCNSDTFHIVPKKFANGTIHKEARCAKCQTYLQYVKSVEPIGQTKNDEELGFKFGKHAGKTLGQVFDQDKDYLTWAAQNWKNEWFKKQIITFLENNSK